MAATVIGTRTSTETLKETLPKIVTGTGPGTETVIKPEQKQDQDQEK